MKIYTLDSKEINICIDALRCLDSEWGLSEKGEELLEKLKNISESIDY